MKEIKAYECVQKLNKDKFGTKHFVFVVDPARIDCIMHDRFSLDLIFDEDQWKYCINISKRDVHADNMDMLIRFIGYMMQFCTKIYEAKSYEGYASRQMAAA